MRHILPALFRATPSGRLRISHSRWQGAIVPNRTHSATAAETNLAKADVALLHTHAAEGPVAGSHSNRYQPLRIDSVRAHTTPSWCMVLPSMVDGTEATC
jgi:hypothetical protein